MTRKKYCLAGLLVLLIAVFVLYVRSISGVRVILETEEKIPCLTLHTEEVSNSMKLWTNENGKSYFFLPAYVDEDSLKIQTSRGQQIKIDGCVLKNQDTFAWQEGKEYLLEIGTAPEESVSYTVEFVKSANIPTAFICTESGSQEYLLESKENEEEGDMCIVTADGGIDYRGELERISGRGNSTWLRYDKKPFAIRLPAATSLCGLKQGEKWCLLALFREGSKMNNKFAMDMAQQMELEYTPQGTWVDLYMNGEYVGIYLLTEAVTIDEGRIAITDLEEENLRDNQKIADEDHYEEEKEKGYDIEDKGNISGGYLIEKDPESYYQEEPNGFITSTGNHFSVKWPKHISRGQMEYLDGYVENIEQKILSGDADLWEYLDLESFARRMLIDEISMDYDACVTSMFFYKERDDDLLYSGPVWDYDIAFGGVNTDDANGKYVDYEGTIIFNGEERNELKWYSLLYENESLQEQLQTEFYKLIPFYQEILENGLDNYADYIRASVHTDAIRWEPKRDYAGWYDDYDANVKYMKFFLAKRMNCIGKRLGADFEEFEIPASDQMHKVTFLMDGKEIKTLTVKDGTELTVDQLPAYDDTRYDGWRYQWGKERFRETIPVYEDMILYNDRLQGDA